MSRLTYDCAVGENHCWQVVGADSDLCEEVCRRYEGVGCDECPIRAAFVKMAAYENICEDPEEIRETMEAKAEGRVIILPAKSVFVLQWDAGEGCNLKCPESDEKGDGRCELCRFGELCVYERPMMQEHIDQLGKSAFLARDDAEKMKAEILAEMENDKLYD